MTFNMKKDPRSYVVKLHYWQLLVSNTNGDRLYAVRTKESFGTLFLSLVFPIDAIEKYNGKP